MEIPKTAAIAENTRIPHWSDNGLMPLLRLNGEQLPAVASPTEAPPRREVDDSINPQQLTKETERSIHLLNHRCEEASSSVDRSQENNLLAPSMARAVLVGEERTTAVANGGTRKPPPDTVAAAAAADEDETDETDRPPLPPYNDKWPSYLMQLTSLANNGDEWVPTMQRICTHPEEIPITGRQGGQNAVHAACLRYPPAHVVQALVEACPEAAGARNFAMQTPLHVASFSASEEVQEVLIWEAPETVSAQDKDGDTPMHFAARQGATYQLMELMVQQAPEAISIANQRGVTPFLLLSRSYLEAESLHDLVTSQGNGDDDVASDAEEDQEGDFHNDWKLLVLFLRFSYYDKDEAIRRHAAAAASRAPTPTQLDWMMYAAASTPACPRETLQFLCRMFPRTALQFDDRGLTPLLYASKAKVVAEPVWDDREDGYRLPVVPGATGPLQNENEETPVEAALSTGDTEFLRNQVLNDSPSQGRPAGFARDPTAQEESKESSPSPTAPSSVLEILLEWSPAAASCADRDGRLPLAHALLSGKAWSSIRALIAACPRALELRDVASSQFMFQLAATHAPDLDTIFYLVRTLPDAVTALAKSRGHAHHEPPCKKLKTGNEPG